MEAFSDGVFAIAITLLVLDIAIPSAEEHDIGRALIDQWPVYLAYLVSFASIGSAWLSHTTITEYLGRADSILLRLNLLLLFFVSLLPLPTRMISEYVDHTSAERLAVTAYGINLLAIAALTSALWHYALSEGLIAGTVGAADVRALTSKLTPSLAFYGVAIGVGLALPRVAVVLYLVIALYVMVPFRTVLRHVRHRRPGRSG
jgi:uncharacterized membrane protein